MMPPVIRTIVPRFLRNNIKKSLHGQGTGRQTPEEIKKLAFEDLGALAAMIGEGLFALGEKITSYDATIGAFVASYIFRTSESPILTYAKTKSELVAYNERIQKLIKK